MRGELKREVEMKTMTTLRVGGKADIIAYPSDSDDLAAVLRLAREKNVPFIITGFGSNLLVSDDGIRGIVINLTKGFKEIKLVETNEISCGAGASLAGVVSYATKKALGGIEFLSGIPGAIGGAVRMNAGGHGREIKDVIKKVSFLGGDGKASTINRDNLSFTYRNMDIEAHAVITACTLALRKNEKEEIKKRISEYTMERKNRQPVGKHTAGSIFKNPSGHYAGKLVEDAGMKGLTVGGARVSDKHANFIENSGSASAVDIIELMGIMRKGVYGKTGIKLEPEINIIGDDLKNRLGDIKL